MSSLKAAHQRREEFHRHFSSVFNIFTHSGVTGDINLIGSKSVQSLTATSHVFLCIVFRCYKLNSNYCSSLLICYIFRSFYGPRPSELSHLSQKSTKNIYIYLAVHVNTTFSFVTVVGGN